MKIKSEISSGNVFADLGLSNPEERLSKAQLASQINDIIEDRGLTQEEAAEILGTERGRLAIFSIERLFRFLTLLGKILIYKYQKESLEKLQAKLASQ
jgi:predicted XRE-type DNA-binding protein